MEAFEFRAKIKDGMIQVPRKYTQKAGATVKVIILTDHGSKHSDMVGELLEHPVKVGDFKPLSRDEIWATVSGLTNGH